MCSVNISNCEKQLIQELMSYYHLYPSVGPDRHSYGCTTNISGELTTNYDYNLENYLVLPKKQTSILVGIHDGATSWYLATHPRWAQ